MLIFSPFRTAIPERDYADQAFPICPYVVQQFGGFVANDSRKPPQNSRQCNIAIQSSWELFEQADDEAWLLRRAAEQKQRNVFATVHSGATEGVEHHSAAGSSTDGQKLEGEVGESAADFLVARWLQRSSRWGCSYVRPTGSK